MPFRVKINQESVVEVLGTEFNVNAYSDDPLVKTTLLQGSVKVSKGNDYKILLPGQQAEIRDKINVNKNVDVEQQIAWKKGIFDFDNKSVDEVMKELARWYDLQVYYENGVPSIEFWGEMQRNLTLSQVLKGLEQMGLHFKAEGRKSDHLPIIYSTNQ